MNKTFLLVLAAALVSCGAQQKAQKPQAAQQAPAQFTGTYVLKADVNTPVKNVIYMIGDGMGLAQVAATYVHRNYEPLAMERAQFIGLAKTYSGNNRVTDSAASGTALSTGHKTYNGAIGVDMDGKPIANILEKAEEAGMATGLVATYAVTHATPASFIAHVAKRSDEEQIAEFFLKTEVDVFMGGGLKFFTQRKDGRDLTRELTQKGYTLIYDAKDIPTVQGDKVGALLAPAGLPTMHKGRGDFLPTATAKSLEILDRNAKQSGKGFFIMVEGSQIDGGGHDNNALKIFEETIDFDNAVKVAFDFADKNPGTLVIVTADHETGGLSLPSGKPDFSLPDQGVKYEFATGGHTGIFVPIYAYGAGAQNFSTLMENTDIPKRIAKLLGLEL